jgi:Flp pilus assembly protein TadG
MSRVRSEERGQIIVLVAMSLVVLLLLAGLAIDGAIAYNVKAKLSAAVDAAALAAGRAGYSNAQSAALTFFDANFPAGYMRTTNVTRNASSPQRNPDNSWNISVTASATVPTFFLRVAGMNSFTASATAISNRRDLDVVFVIDTSGSLQSSCNAGDPNDLQAISKVFVNQMDQFNDNMALIHFAIGAQVDVPINSISRGFDRTAIENRIDSFTCGGNTDYAAALWNARDQLVNVQSAGNRAGLQAIVFFSDGSPNSFSSTFTKSGGGTVTGVIISDDDAGGIDGLYAVDVSNPRNTLYNYRNTTGLPAYFNVGGATISSTEFGITTNTPAITTWRAVGTALNGTNVNRAARNLAESMAQQFRSQGIYIFTLGFNGQGLLTAPGPNGERGADILKRMANDPGSSTYNPNSRVGMYCQAANMTEVQACYQAIASRLSKLTQ